MTSRGMTATTEETFARLSLLIQIGDRVNFTAAMEEITNGVLKFDINYQDAGHKNSLLHVACQNGNKVIVKNCLRSGAYINCQNSRGNTPLHYCFAYGYTELGQYLVSKGADDAMRNVDGLTCYEGLNGDDISLL